jgi:hypothetical protein
VIARAVSLFFLVIGIVASSIPYPIVIKFSLCALVGTLIIINILPSIYEGLPLCVLEAMASGCAIVSTVPLDYEGVKINYGNTEQLKEALRFLYDNREVSLKMGRVNREKAKDYTWDNFIEKLIHVYEEVMISHAHKKATRRECQGR